MTTFKIYNDDCRKALKNLADNSIDSIVTDPPYELGFMGNEWDKSSIAYDIAVWEACLRVLKPGGHLLAFGAPRTQHRLVCAIEDAGLEIRDQLIWIYSTGMPKGKKMPANDCWHTSLKPAHEPICLARKPFTGTVVGNFKNHGTGALNIEACRIPVCKKQNVCPAATIQGRFPGNVLHDGSDAVISLFPQSAGQLAPTRADGGPMRNKIYGAMKHGFVTAVPRGDSGSAARFFYSAKATRMDREEGLGLQNGRRKNTHTTVKPTVLMQWLCRLVTPPGGIILDPFMGSGSTGKAAMLEGMGFIGIEMSEEYARIAEARILWAQNS
jgi:DNA modification methylase